MCCLPRSCSTTPIAGRIWLHPFYHGSKAGHEAVFLLLRRAFELNYRRVEWQLDTMDAWSRGLASKCNFFLEGIMKKHMIVGKISRDTVCYAILNSDWPPICADLMKKLKFPAPKKELAAGKGSAGGGGEAKKTK